MTIKTDIVIIGGGVAGFAAAMAASLENKKVLLIDKSNLPGGDSVHTNVGTLCGAYYRSFSGIAKEVGYSFNRSFLQALQKADHKAASYMYTEGLYIIPYEWSTLQNLYIEMLKQANVECLLNASLVDVNLKDKKIISLTVLQDNTIITIQGDSIIDCSGQALVSQKTGIETIKENSYQAASQIFRLNNISDTTEFSLNMALKLAVAKRMEEMSWPVSYKSISVVPGSLRDDRVDLKLTLPEIITDEFIRNKDFTVKTHKRVEELFLILKHEVSSLAESSLEIIFPQPGIRVVQRSKGKYILNESDVMSCKKTADGIAVGTWPIEEWSHDGSLKMEYFEADKGYSIPAGCLISDAVDNLFFGGKNISATAKAIASARVMGTALQTGYAAGKIACGKNEEEQRKIIETLHHELEED
ncbi:MAG TPA: FAD-dependent oxidoreductase [Cyclobacteriaceae bacterium]|nr:FAD-dependent oxidoreductase [Cyclobacteriaceae bacterium]